MTTPQGSTEEAVGYVSVAASAAGMAAEFEKIGRECSNRFASAVKQNTARLGDDMLAGLDSSRASMAGAAFGEAIGRAVVAPITLAREAFQGLTRSGTESADALRTRYNTLDEQIRKTTLSIKAMQAEARDSAATSGGSTFDATKILAATTALEGYRKEQGNVAEQLKATDDAAKSSGSSMEHAGLVGGLMGGAIVAGSQLAVEGLESIMEGAHRAAEALIGVGEQGEQMTRALRLSTTASGEELEGLKATIDQVATHTSAGFDVITNAAGVLHQRLGMSGGELGLITQDFADFQKMTGQALDPGKFSAAMTALGVPAAQADQFLTQLFTLSRETSVPLGQLVSTLSQNAAALHEFGLNALPVASILAQMSANGINAQSAMRGLQTLSKSAAKDHETVAQKLREIVAGMEAAKAAGDRVAENEWASKLGRGALQFEDAVDQGIVSTQSLNAALGDLNGEPIRNVFDDTATLSDKIAELGHTVDADLRPVGEAIVESLGGGFEHVSDWIKSNGPTVLQWLENLGEGAIVVGGQLAAMFGNLMSGVGALEEAYGTLNDDDGAKKAGQSLEDLGTKLAEAGTNTDALTQSWDKLMDRAKENVTLGDDLKDALKLGPDGQGVQLTDSKALQADLSALRAAGVDIQQTPHGLNIVASTPENEARIKSFLDGIGAKSIPITVVPQIAPPPAPGAPALPPPPAPNSSSGGGAYSAPPNPSDQFDWLDPWGLTNIGGTEWLDPWGVFKDDQGGGNDDFRDRLKNLPPGTGGRPAPGAHPSGNSMPIPATITVQPAANRTDLGQILDSAGIPAPNQDPTRGVVFNAGMTVGTNDALDPADVMSKAGIPDRFQGAVPDGGEGVTMPTAFDVKTSDRKTVGDLMESIGIPSENQGPDGVTLSVSYSGGSSTATMPAGFSGPGGPVAGPTSPGQAGMAQAVYNAVLQAGYSPQTAQYAVAASLLESGLDPDITNASGHHGLFQESSDKPSAGALQQIEWFLGELGRQGGPAAVNAYPGGPGAFIADRVEVGGYPGTNYDQFLGQAQTLIGQTPGGGAPGVVPAGYTGGGSDYAGVGAGDNASTADPRHGAIPGAPSGEGQPLLATIKSVMDAFNTSTGSSLRVTGDMPGGPVGHGDDGGQHSSRRALDIGGTQQQMDAFVQMWVSNPALLAATRQLIHDDPNNPGIASLNAIGGHLTSGPGTYGDEYAQHQDHIHLALQDVPGAGAGGPVSVVPADFTTGGASPTVVNVDRVTRDNGNPTTPQPVAPGSQFNAVPPPPDFPTVPQGTPKSVDTPWGSFLHTFDMDPAQQQLLTPEQRQKYDQWLNAYTASLETATDSQDEVNRAQQRLDKALAKKTDADAGVLPGDPDSTNAAASADDEYTNAVADLAKAKRHATDAQNRANTEAEKPAPWESAKGSTAKPDKNAEDLGKGFLKGVMQELGFPDVFGKSIDQWGITKLLTGGAGYGLGLLQNMTKLPGQGGSPATPSGGGGVASGLLDGAFPALKNLLQPTQGVPAFTPSTWTPGGAPAPASNTPAGVGSATPAIQPAGFPGGPGSTTNNPLTVNVTNQGFTPSPQVSDTIRDISNSTSAPAMSGGGGIPT